MVSFSNGSNVENESGVRISKSIMIVGLLLLIGGTQIAGQNKRQPAVQEIAGRRADASQRWLIARLEELIPRLMSEGDVPGLSIVLIHNGRVSWHRGFGVKNVETKASIDDVTIFETASLTKPVFAYGVLKLVDNGKLDLDTPLARYLPGIYVEGDARANLITARMVLSHTTGLQNELHPGELLQIHFNPGERFSYSGEGFLYLQRVVEHITGERLDVYMKRMVFDPLGIRSASYVWQDRYETLMANGHNAASVVAERIKPTEVKLAWLHMNPLDYSKFVIAIMNGIGLRKTTATLMLTPQVHIDESCVFCLSPGTGRVSSSLSWALGWGLERIEGRDAFWHWGENRGEFQTFVVAYPRQKVGVVIFTNSGNGFSIIPEIVSQAIGGKHPEFAWMGYEPYNSPKFLAHRTEILPAKTLYEAILLRGSAALAEYREGRKTRSGSEVLNEDQMNKIGYWLLKKRVNEAIEVFKMNVTDYPNSANAYDSLGEAYLVAGNKPEAIKNYQRSLALNPGNDNARQMIQNLERH